MQFVQGSEPNARLLRRNCGGSRGSPRSFAAQKRLAQDDKANCTAILYGKASTDPAGQN
jgi:hypothetical protein